MSTVTQMEKYHLEKLAHIQEQIYELGIGRDDDEPVSGADAVDLLCEIHSQLADYFTAYNNERFEGNRRKRGEDERRTG